MKASGVLPAALVTVDIGGYNDVAKSNVFDAARHADKQGDLWTEMLNGSLGHSRGRRVADADLSDCNFPALKAATAENGALDDFFGPAWEVPEDGTRLDL
jgi:hypothetical protein